MRKFINIIAPFKFLFFITLILVVSLNFLFAIIDPLLMKFLLDEGLMKHNFKFFVILSLGVILIGTAIRVGSMVYTFFTQKLKNKIIESLTLEMLDSYNNLPYHNIITQDTGYFISRIYDEPIKISNFVEVIFNSLISSITLLGALIICLWLSVRLTVFLVIVVPTIYYLGNRYGRKIKIKSKEENETEGICREILGRAVESYRNIKIFSLHSFVRSSFRNYLKNFLTITYSRIKLSAIFQTLSSIFLSYGELIVLISAGYEVMKNQLTIGGLFGFMSAFWKVISSAQQMIQQIPEISRLRGYVERIEEFKRSAKEKPAWSLSSEKIELNKCSFSFKNKSVINNLTLKFKKGERILIEGENGVGKSTLANIICGFLNRDRGSISSFAIEKISAGIYPFNLPKGCLKDIIDSNPIFAKSKDKFLELVEELGLKKDLYTDFSSLSAGQRKKVEVIMTLMKNADLYIFDEPTANLDENSKNLIMDRIFIYTQGKTLIIIMHGDKKYRHLFDRIIRLEREA